MLGEGPHAPLPETALHPILVRKKSEKLNRSLLVSRIVEISLRSRPFAVPNLDNMIQNSFKHPLGQFSYPHPRCPPFRKMRSGSCCCWSWKHLNRIRLLVYKIRAPAWQSFLLGPSPPPRGSQCLLAKDNRNRSQKDHVTVGGWYLMVPPARCRIGFQRLGGKDLPSCLSAKQGQSTKLQTRLQDAGCQWKSAFYWNQNAGKGWGEV